MDTPRLFFFINRDYCYPTLHLARFHGKQVKVQSMFLESGCCISGEFTLRVISSPMHGRVDLLEQSPGNDPTWLMLTRDEAELVVTHVTGEASATNGADHTAVA
jgi:hypothetical protein